MKIEYKYKWDWSFDGDRDLVGFGKYITDKSSGIRAFTGSSCYKGHKRAVVRATTRKSMDVALKKLKSWGLIDTISEGRRYVVSDALGY